MKKCVKHMLIKNGCDNKICIIFSSLYYFYYMQFEWCYNYVFLISLSICLWVDDDFLIEVSNIFVPKDIKRRYGNSCVKKWESMYDHLQKICPREGRDWRSTNISKISKDSKDFLEMYPKHFHSDKPLGTATVVCVHFSLLFMIYSVQVKHLFLIYAQTA